MCNKLNGIISHHRLNLYIITFKMKIISNDIIYFN